MIDGKIHYSDFENYFDKNGNGYGMECWLNGDWRLSYYIPTIISLLFHYTALIIAINKFYQTRKYTRAYIYLIKRLIPWIIIYSVIKILPTIVRIWGLVSNPKNIPLWMVVLHHCSITGVGVANALVWYFSMRVDPSKEYQIQTLSLTEPIIMDDQINKNRINKNRINNEIDDFDDFDEIDTQQYYRQNSI